MLDELTQDPEPGQPPAPVTPPSPDLGALPAAGVPGPRPTSQSGDPRPAPDAQDAPPPVDDATSVLPEPSPSTAEDELAAGTVVLDDADLAGATRALGLVPGTVALSGTSPSDVDRTGGSPAPGDATTPVPAPGALLGSYRIERELGRGGMGVVYLAEDLRLRRRVALKVLPDSVASNPVALQAFEREARLLAALHHTHIATIFSLETTGALRYFTMEYVEGTQLAARLRAARLSVPEALGLGRQVARALQAAHARGVVHRDLKPANIALTPDGQAKILDFGIAAARGECARQLAVAETTGELAGTPGYMSPEQYEGTSADERVDIWAFGCVLYECLAGRRAILAANLMACVEATRRAAIDWTALPSTTPSQVRELLERCLEPDASRRLSSMAEACRVLDDTLALDAHGVIASDAPTPDTPHNLPARLTRFVGRVRLLALVVERLRDGPGPLVTLVGTGGSGKTRLALEAAHGLLGSFPDGVTLAELAALTKDADVARTVAAAFGLQEETGRDLTTVIATHLGTRRVLLVLDNCERVASGVAALIEALARTCPHLRVLATSRVALAASGEQTLSVPPLELPTIGRVLSVAELRRSEAVALFLERARAAQPGFELTEANAPAVLEIVRRLDGIPLALELAAARVRVLSVQDLERRLADRFRLLRGSRTTTPHQQTLEAAIAWSYDHLDEDEQRLLRRFSVFQGGWTLEAAEHVCAYDPIDDLQVLDLLASLIDQSLVEVGATRGGTSTEASGSDSATAAGAGEPPAGEPPGEGRRYRLLESIREYARLRGEELGEIAEQRVRHRQYFAGLAARAHEDLRGPRQAHWFEVLEGESDNLRAAVRRSLESGDGVPDTLQMANHLAMFWIVRGSWSEGRATLEDLLAHPAALQGDAVRARALCWAGNLAGVQGDYAAAEERVRAGLALQEQLAHPEGIAGALNDLAILMRKRGDLATARELFERSLALRRDLGDAKGVAVALSNLGLVALEGQDLEVAARYYDEALGALRSLGDLQGIAVCVNSLGSIDYNRGALDSARRHYEEALALSRSMGNRRTERNIIHNLGLVAHRQGDLATANVLLRESLRARAEMGDRAGVLSTLSSLAEIALDAHDPATAREFLDQALAERDLLEQSAAAPHVALMIARLAAHHGCHQDAARLIGWAHGRESGEAADEAPAWQQNTRGSLDAQQWDRLTQEARHQPLTLVSAFLRQLP